MKDSHQHEWTQTYFNLLKDELEQDCPCGATRVVAKDITKVYRPDGQITRRATTEKGIYDLVVARCARQQAEAQAAREEMEAVAAANPEAVQAAIENMAQVAAERAQAVQAETITLVATENPKRPGSASFARFALYQTGMTIAEYLKAGGQRSDIRWDTARGFITLG